MASQNNTRIWESPPSNPISSPINSLNHDHVKPAQLPSIATLTSELPSRNAQPSSPNYPSNNNNRTSDPWGSQTQSTREFTRPSCPRNLTQQRGRYEHSANYTIGSSAFSGFGYASSSISSPQRVSNTSQFGTTSYPADMSSPTSAGAQASSGFASPQQESRISQLSQPEHHRSSHHSDSFPPQESRRSSLGSAVNSGFGNLQLNGSGSPYGTHGNPSHSSIAASLQRERGSLQANGVRNSTASSIHQHSFSPLGPQQGESRQQYNSRTAPSITHNPIREVYNADQPTAGQPYAFPDPDMPPHESKPHLEANGRATLSRRNSDHASIASSIITTDSKYPPGQARLDEGTISHFAAQQINTDQARSYAWHAPSLVTGQAHQRYIRRRRLSRSLYTLQPDASATSQSQDGGAKEKNRNEAPLRPATQSNPTTARCQVE